MQRIRLFGVVTGLLLAMTSFLLGGYGLYHRVGFDLTRGTITNCVAQWNIEGEVYFLLEVNSTQTITTDLYSEPYPCPHGTIRIYRDQSDGRLCAPDWQVGCPRVSAGFLIMIFFGVACLVLLLCIVIYPEEKE